jgi:hypothetical protein
MSHGIDSRIDQGVPGAGGAGASVEEYYGLLGHSQTRYRFSIAFSTKQSRIFN